MKFFKLILRKLFLGCFILYCYNYVSINFNLLLPINVFNIFVVSFLGPFGLIGLVFFKYIFM